MARTVKAYSISADDIASEKQRVADGASDIDIASVI